MDDEAARTLVLSLNSKPRPFLSDLWNASVSSCRRFACLCVTHTHTHTQLSSFARCVCYCKVALADPEGGGGMEGWKGTLSMVAQIRSRNSMTVTLEPRRAQTEPSSSPITPPPTIASVLGTCGHTALSASWAPLGTCCRRLGQVGEANVLGQACVLTGLTHPGPGPCVLTGVTTRATPCMGPGG